MNAAEQYIEDVLSGLILANQWIKKAAKRHKRDLIEGPKRGLVFRPDQALRVLRFFGFLNHSKGEWAGTVIKLEPWEQFIIWVLFGWYKVDGTRRFNTAYVSIARKNGKTTLAAGLGIYGMDADSEPGAEIYSAATKRAQAKLSHDEAVRMVKASVLLKRRITIYKDLLINKKTNSLYIPLGRDSNTMDGLNVHMAIVDELMAHKTREVWDILDTATAARRNPLLFAITTAGYNRQSICYEQHSYTEKILDGIFEDDSFFGVIYGLEKEDDWQDEKLWIKANPNLGVSVKRDDLRRKVEKAKAQPAALNSFLRLHMNLWTQAESRWVDVDKWANCGELKNDIKAGRHCYGGLDLSTSIDITAFVLVFPPSKYGEPYKVLARFWVPEDNMYEREHKDRVPYMTWAQQGLVTPTPGNRIDHKLVLRDIGELGKKYDIKQIAYDRFGAQAVEVSLRDDYGFEVAPFGQGYVSMSPPLKDLEGLIYSTGIAHGDNPVLNWMAHNMVVHQDPAGNMKPDKNKSSEKIDGMIALIMALARAITNDEKPTESIYEQRGIESV